MLHVPPKSQHPDEGPRSAASSDPTIVRKLVLARLGLAGLLTPEYLDIDAGHRAHADVQRKSATFRIGGLTIEAPAGVYHPTPESSSLLFIHNIEAMCLPRPERVLEIGTGCGVIALYLASLWPGKMVATDLSQTALSIARANADRNRLNVEFVQSDLFADVPAGKFDLIVFNTPLIDKAPEDDLERESLCDPGGRVLRGYLEGLSERLKDNGVAFFGLCCNTAYQQLDNLPLKFQVIGLELIGAGFWRAVVAARRAA